MDTWPFLVVLYVISGAESKFPNYRLPGHSVQTESIDRYLGQFGSSYER